MIQLGEHFRRDDRSRHSEWLRHQRWFIKARHDQERKEKAADRLEGEDIISLAFEAIMATEAQIAEFEERLDAYSEASTRALMENREKTEILTQRLTEIQARIRDKLEKAYVMDDGRRVFLNEDRTMARDELGKEVTREELDFNLVPLDNPTWESLSNDYAEERKVKTGLETLAVEREQIHKFEDKVESAREEKAKGNMTADRLEELKSELEEATPLSVRKQMPGYSAAQPPPSLKSAFAAPANPAILNQAANLAATIQAPDYTPMG